MLQLVFDLPFSLLSWNPATPSRTVNDTQAKQEGFFVFFFLLIG